MTSSVGELVLINTYSGGSSLSGQDTVVPATEERPNWLFLPYVEYLHTEQPAKT